MISTDKAYQKTITVSIPCRNEENNVKEIFYAIEEQFKRFLPEYDYIVQFSDNCSTDNTRSILRQLCNENSHVCAIFNTSNVPGSAIHSLLQAKGECCIHMSCDFQDPPELIPDMVKKWELGARIICAIKTTSQEKKSMWRIRSLYYKIMCKFSKIPQIEHFTGFGLYDRFFIEIIRQIEDPLITLRGLVAEYGDKIEKIFFNQPARKKEKSRKSLIDYYDYAVRSFTSYTRIGIHLATLLSIFIGSLSLICFIALIFLNVFININVDLNLAILICFFIFVESVQLFFVGLVGSYILNMNVRLMKRPLAIESERIGFRNNNPKPENSSPYIVNSAQKENIE